MSFKWRWTNGEEPQEKSLRRITKKIITNSTSINKENNKTIAINDPPPPPTEYSRTGGLRNTLKTNNTETQSLTPQEELYDRLNHREQIVQIGQNPFHKNNYIEDIDIQDKFLRGKIES